MPNFLVFLALADTLGDIGDVITAVWLWFGSTLTAIETAVGTSVILQIALGVTAVPLGIGLVGLVIGLIKKIASRSAKKSA